MEWELWEGEKAGGVVMVVCYFCISATPPLPTYGVRNRTHLISALNDYSPASDGRLGIDRRVRSVALRAPLRTCLDCLRTN